ncbi:MAG: SCO1664 family protein [SAR202 cluster bacterium]|nr:SCO1664 family protein [SAR202 cluster bacterium]MDP6300631.1 SCO1664 family protein [SAR202 cluster bacterium]MDP7102355.1 SCO1664 family protein [SAR202 cluster bacterium]MDP7225450.1 SCO1664 family protein [SAR202 cluster bacterium]MDP7414123.1 SCO1664 family protein [SAR202 cluster bacterium]
MPPRIPRDSRSTFPTPDGAVPIDLSEDEATPILRSGEIIGGHRMPWGSNYTFLIWIDAGPGKYLRAIYKPRDGERPLRDFPGGTLYKREHATFLLSRMLGWPGVPYTIVRDGPYGVGSVQLYVESDPEVTYFDMVNDREDELMQFAVFDLLVNNADRKAGHCLLGSDGRVWSIDHGLTFHTLFKVRTVMLEFWGQTIPAGALADLEALLARLEAPHAEALEFADLIHRQEERALTARIRAMLDDPELPGLDSYVNVPWPFV